MPSKVKPDFWQGWVALSKSRFFPLTVVKVLMFSLGHVVRYQDIVSCFATVCYG